MPKNLYILFMFIALATAQGNNLVGRGMVFPSPSGFDRQIPPIDHFNKISVPLPYHSCSTIICGFGTTCRDGRCVQPTPVDHCDNVVCTFGYLCRNGRCTPNSIDHCANVRCREGLTCQNGQCIVSDRCSLVRCPRGQECKHGICVIKERSFGKFYCPRGYVYQNEGCVPGDEPRPNQCSSYLPCRIGKSCENGRCVLDRCMHIRCLPQYSCLFGKCLPRTQNRPIEDTEQHPKPNPYLVGRPAVIRDQK